MLWMVSYVFGDGFLCGVNWYKLFDFGFNLDFG